MNIYKIFFTITALALLSVLVACEGEEESYGWRPGGTLHVLGDESVPVLTTASYRVDGFTVDESYTWTLNGNAVDPVRQGEFVEIMLPAPGEYELSVTNGSLSGTTTVTALPVTLGLAGSAATVAENSDTVNILLNLSYENGGAALDGPLTVDYTLGGTAVAGEDYTLLSPDPFVVAAGREQDTIQVLLRDNTLQEDAKTLTVTLTSVVAEGATAGVGLPADSLRTYTVTVVNDQKVVALTEPPVDTLSAITDAGTYTFEVMLSAAAGSDVTVPYTVTGEGVNDLTAGEVTLLAGQMTSDIIIEVEPTAFTTDQTISVTLGEAASEDQEVTYETDEEDNEVGTTGTIVIVASE